MSEGRGHGISYFRAESPQLGFGGLGSRGLGFRDWGPKHFPIEVGTVSYNRNPNPLRAPDSF